MFILCRYEVEFKVNCVVEEREERVAAEIMEAARSFDDVWTLLDSVGKRMGLEVGEYSSVQVIGETVVLPQGERGDQQSAETLAHNLAYVLHGRKRACTLPTPPAGCKTLWERWSAELEAEEEAAEQFAATLLSELATPLGRKDDRERCSA